MNQGQKQVARLEGCLTPKQAVLVWLEEVAHCRNLFEFAAYLRNQPESARPLRHLPEQLEHSIEQAMKGEPKDRLKAEVRRAVRDAAFLVYLHRHANIRVTAPMRAWGYELAFLRERLYRLSVNRVRSERASHVAGSRSARPRRTRNRALEQDWVEAVGQFLTELYAARNGVKSVSDTYFDGHELLFISLAKSLDAIISETERLAELFNYFTEGRSKKQKRVDPSAILKASRAESDRQLAMTVCTAKSDALTFMGDDKGALELADRLIELDVRAPDRPFLAGVLFG